MTERDPQGHLAYLFRRQGGICHICGKPALLDGNGGKANNPNSAVRFRLGSKFGKPGRVRPKIMAHRACAQQRSSEIEQSVSIEERWLRSGRPPTELYEAKP